MTSVIVNGEATSPNTLIFPSTSFSDLNARRASHKLLRALSSMLVAFIAIISFGSLTVRAAGCTSANFTQPAGSPISIPNNNPKQVVTADFNLDGKPDIAVMPTSATGGSVFLGNGNGGFGAAKPFIGLGDVLAVGDFNGDGKPDLVSLARSNSGSNKITILFGDGAGNFTAAPGSPFTPSSAADFLVVADFNVDGKVDLAFTTASNTAAVTILLGNGNGGFTSAGSSISVGGFPQDFVAADLNLDGKPDLIVATSGANTVTILLGDGAGGFSQPSGPPVVSSFPTGLAVGDFNLDGKPDLAVASNSSLSATFFLGNGSGGFTKTNQSIFVYAPISIATADLNLDGLPDVVIADASTGAVILLGDGSGHFATAASSPISVGNSPFSVTVADFNLDGRTDFATANFNSKDISIELNSCSGVANTLQFSSATYNMQEALGALTITVTRSGDTSGSASVNYASSDGTAKQHGDYEIALGTVTFAPGDTTKTFQVLINEDNYVEGAESFTLSLSNAAGATLGSPGTATVTISDDSPESLTSPIDDAQSFVWQQYHDFLNREPDPPGLAGWTNTLLNCAPGDTSCDRIHVSAGFFQSPEFQQRGYFLYRLYSVGLGRKPDYSEFAADMSRLSGFLDANQLEAAKVQFITDFMARPAYVSKYNALNNAAFVQMEMQTAGVNLPNSGALVTSLDTQTATRAQVLRQIVESSEVYQKYYNQAFVVMQYFGYLRRDPDALYLNWIAALDQSGDPRAMVSGFINSLEYRQRFGQ